MTGTGQALLAWVRQWDGYVKLNAIVSDSKDLAVIVVPDQTQMKRFIGGADEKRVVFALTAMLDYSAGSDDTNLDATELMESWADWVDDMQEAKNYPEIPGTVEEVGSLDNYPYMAMTYQGDKLAKYQFQAYVTYLEGES